MASHQNAACDTCKMRKVKCDRDDPCGNCIDGNIQCVRTPSSSRQARSTSKRCRPTESLSAQKSSRHHEIQISPSPSRHAPSVPQSPSLLEAQDFIRQEIKSGKHMPADRQAVLNDAMTFVNRLSQASTISKASSIVNPRVVDVLEDITFPSVELLYWMLRELKRKNIGPHVLDFFKHVSPKSLKDMGLALINKAGSAETLLFYSICVNSAAYKFLNTVLSEDSMGETGAGMRDSAARYLMSVKLAMTRIHLLSTPSLTFLQSLLCSAFIAQGAGDLTHCWTLINAACKVCEDLGLEAQVKAAQMENEDETEMYYCYIWCHILDKNYSMMLGRRHTLLEYEGLDSTLSSPLTKSMSSLLFTYLHFVPIQAIYISKLHPDRIVNKTSLLSKVERVVKDLLDRLEHVHTKITELHGKSDSWGGLHSGSELNTIKFTYHSIRTSILRSNQICLPGKLQIDNECLQSARMAMTTLRAIQEESLAISDIRTQLSYMHWSILYHPLTPLFVLFCNIVASSDEQDFQLLQRVASQLDDLAGLSPSIAKLQMLFKSFIGFCERLVIQARSSTSLATGNHEHQLAVDNSQNRTLPPQLSAQIEGEQAYPPVNMGELPFQQIPMLLPAQDEPPDFAFQTAHGLADPGWGLFDTQPTLDWLDADFLYFDNNRQ